MMAKNEVYINNIRWQQFLFPVLVLCLSFSPSGALAQTGGSRVYTEDRPLVYEDVATLAPYSFLNEEGQPDGYDIDLVKLLLKELDIPYVIRLKPLKEVMNDLKTHQADLAMGLAAGISDLPAHLGHDAIVLSTQSVVTPKSKPVTIKNFRDLSKPGTKVIVGDSSFCHHLMLDFDWDDHIVVSKNIRESIKQVNDQQEGQIVSSTLSLKWLIKQYQLDKVELTPVNMPHGEYRFMSHDQHLLHQLDEAYSRLFTADKLEPLENKWFYPDREEPQPPAWVWYLVVLALLLLAAAVAYIAIYRLKDLRVTAANNKLNHRLALIIETCQVRIWTYHVDRKEFAWHNENGKVACTYSFDEFMQRYNQHDTNLLKDAIYRLVNQHKDARGHEEEELKLELQAKDVEGGDDSVRDFVVVLSVLSRDIDGRPTVIIGTKKDVTAARDLRKVNAARSLRYWSMFYTPDSGVIFFDKQGCVKNANVMACEMYQCDIDEKVSAHTHLNDWFHTGFTDLSEADGHHATSDVGDQQIEYMLKTVHNDHGSLLGVFAFCRYLAAVVVLFAFVLEASAQALSERYNRQRPVVIVCDRDLKPYEFINDAGEAAGCNVEIVKAVLNKLDLPYKFVMKERHVMQMTFENSGTDLILANGHQQGGSFYVSKNAINFLSIGTDSLLDIHFVGKDRQLVDQMSAQYDFLRQRGDIAAIRNRWLHPELVEPESTPPVVYIMIGLLLLAAVLYLLSVLVRAHIRRMSSSSDEVQRIMYKALHMGNYDVMQYDIARNRITNQYGTILPDDGLTLEGYIQRIDPSQRAEFSQKMRSLLEGRERHFELNKRWNHGTEESPEYRYFQGHAICELDKKGRPAYVINAVNDVTQETKEVLSARDQMCRYKVLLSNPFVAMAFYDKRSEVIDQNDAMRKFGDAKASKHVQPLYNAKGEIACFFVSKPLSGSDEKA